MRAEKENQIFVSKEIIISSKQPLNDKNEIDKIQFSFIDQNCTGKLGNKTHHFTKDLIIITDSNSSSLQINTQKDTTFKSISFDKKRFTSLLSQVIDQHQSEIKNESTNFNSESNEYVIYNNQHHIQSLLSELFHLNTKPNSSIKTKLVELKTEVFILESIQTPLVEFYTSLLGENYFKDPISYSLQIIHSNPQQNWSVNELAQKANVSESTLYRYFKKNLNTTPNQYLWDIKLNHAKRLLRENLELNISQIGYNVGIQNPFYFSKIFKQHVGTSPKQYRIDINKKTI